jgi:hypothetical protein
MAELLQTLSIKRTHQKHLYQIPGPGFRIPEIYESFQNPKPVIRRVVFIFCR